MSTAGIPDVFKQFAAQSAVALVVALVVLGVMFAIVGSMECLPPTSGLDPGQPPPTTLPPPDTVATGCFGNDPNFLGMPASVAPWTIAGIAAAATWLLEKGLGAFRGLLDA